MGDRRSFIAGMLAAGLIPKPTWADVGSPAFLSAGKKPDGSFVLCGLCAIGQITFEKRAATRTTEILKVATTMTKMPISADSHITEPPNLYRDYIDPRYRDVAPHVVDDPKRGEIYVIDGIDIAIPLSLVAAAGKAPSELSTKGAVFNELHRGGWDPKARAADQDRAGS